MVRIGVNDDLIGIPKPIGANGEIKSGHAPVEIIEPKPARTASGQAPHVASAEATGKAPVLKGVIQMEAGIVLSLIVANPLAVVMNVRRFRVTLSVGVARCWRRLSRPRMRSWATGRNESSAHFTARLVTPAATTVFFVLRKSK